MRYRLLGHQGVVNMGMGLYLSGALGGWVAWSDAKGF